MATEIWTAADFDTEVRADLSGDYVQMADINLHSFTNWVPFGFEVGEEFTGSYDGGGFKISNIVINTAGTTYAGENGNGGLFGICVGATIENVHLRNVGVYSEDDGVGALCGSADGCTITKCSAVNGATRRIAGINYVGGLVGYADGTSISQCYTEIEVRANGTDIGGLVGYTDDATVSNCYSRGNVLGVSDVGENVAGFVGYTKLSTIEYCYSAGLVADANDMSGFCGENDAVDSSTITRCYYDEDTSGQSDVGKGDPKTTANMELEATYVDWNFVATWRIFAGVRSSYPYLAWEESALSFYPDDDPVIIPLGGAIGVFGHSTDTTPSSVAIWTVDDGAVASVVQDEIGGSPPSRLGGVILRGLTVGVTTLHVITTAEPIKVTTVNIEVKAVSYFAQDDFDEINIVDVDFVVQETILNNEIVDITIDRELSGEYSMNFTVPYDAQGADDLKRGMYLDAEGNYFLIDSISTVRNKDGLLLKEVKAVHEFFDNQHIPTLWHSDVFAGVIAQLRRALYQRDIHNMVVCILDDSDDFYTHKRYLSIRPNDSRLKTVLKCFQTFGGQYRLWRNYLIVIPYQALPVAADLKLEYAVNNTSIERVEYDRDIYTKIYAQGGTVGTEENPETLEVVVDAPPAVVDAYRWPRYGYIDFGDVTSTATLTYMAEQYLDLQERARVIYTLSVAELKRLSSPPAGDWDIEIGRAVNVKDTDLGIDVFRHIISYRYNPLKPESPSEVSVGGRINYLYLFRRVEDAEIQFGGRPSRVVPESVEVNVTSDDAEPLDVLRGFVSSSDPVFSRGEENNLWFKY